MEVPDQLRCLFASSVDERDGSYVVDIPAQELQNDEVESGETYRVALLHASAPETPEASPRESQRDPASETPPVSAGDRRRVEIEDIGEQGDGITRLEHGFVVIVPGTTRGEQVTIEITNVRETVAFAVIEQQD